MASSIENDLLQPIEDIGFFRIGRDNHNWIFISEDPIGFSGEDVNLFRYVGNSPVNWIDPLGLLRKPGNRSPLLAHIIYFINEDHDWAKIGFGAIGLAEGIQTIAIGGTAIVGTAILTENPVLTIIVAVEMVPVFWTGVEKTKHGFEMIKEGIDSHESQLLPLTCHDKSEEYLSGRRQNK